MARVYDRIGYIARSLIFSLSPVKGIGYLGGREIKNKIK